MKRLDLRPHTTAQALTLLGKWNSAFLTQDGKEPQGSLWIACLPLPDVVVQSILAAGYARLVEVEQWTDAQVASYLYALDSEQGEISRSSQSEADLVTDIDYLVNALVCTDNSMFTRYDSDTWLITQADGWPLETPEERLQLFKLGMAFSNSTVKG